MSSVPTIIFEDTARARLTDPLASHEAADRSQANKERVTDAVQHLLFDAGFHGLTDEELNFQYSEDADYWGWPAVKFETPRRRRSDLAKDGRVVPAVFRRPNSDGALVTVWVLPQYKDGLK